MISLSGVHEEDHAGAILDLPVIGLNKSIGFVLSASNVRQETACRAD